MSKKTAKKDDQSMRDVTDLVTLLRPPTTLVVPNQINEAEKAFLDQATKQEDTLIKPAFITVDHKRQAFTMPNGDLIDGNDGINGFIIAHFTNRGLYLKPYDPKGDKVPPDCKSFDCVTPDKDVLEPKNPDCASCKYNVFGSANVGKGKACKERIWLWLVNPEFGTPPLAVLILPPSSIGRFYGGQMKRGYFDQLKTKHRAWQIVWNKITLERESDEAIHCVPRFEMGDIAEIEVAKSLAMLNNQFVDMIKKSRHEAPPKEVVSQE